METPSQPLPPVWNKFLDQARILASSAVTEPETVGSQALRMAIALDEALDSVGENRDLGPAKTLLRRGAEAARAEEDPLMLRIALFLEHEADLHAQESAEQPACDAWPHALVLARLLTDRQRQVESGL